jgi:hypothetical protein
MGSSNFGFPFLIVAAAEFTLGFFSLTLATEEVGLAFCPLF